MRSDAAHETAPRNAPTAPPAIRLVGPGPLVLAATESQAPPTMPVLTVRALDAVTLLHGWRSADQVLDLLGRVASRATVLTVTAVTHAAQLLEPRAPGSAAMCGLARTLLSPGARRGTLTRDVAAVARSRIAHPSRLPLPEYHALATVVALSRTHPRDAAAAAPLFLELRRLPAGGTLSLLSGSPLMVVRGTVDVTDPADDGRLVVGGLDPGSDPFAFSRALRAVPAAPVSTPRPQDVP